MGKPYREQDKAAFIGFHSGIQCGYVAKINGCHCTQKLCNTESGLLFICYIVHYSTGIVKIQSFLWIVPFLAFVYGYFSISLFFPVRTIIMPQLIGQPLITVMPLLSQHHIYPQVVAQHEDNDIDAGIILSQIPAAGKKIKPYQSIFITLSTRANPIRAPQCIGEQNDSLTKLLQKNTLGSKQYYLPCAYLHDTCFAQYPSPRKKLTEKQQLIIYLAQQSSSIKIFPNFKEKEISTVIDFLSLYSIAPEIIEKESKTTLTTTSQARILDQRPLPGSFVHLNQSIIVQLYI